MSNSNDSRWWEFYGVRYAMGTFVGALVVYYIFMSNTHLKELLFLPKDGADFGMAHLTLLAAYGLAYCYIASAPILIMHAARMYLWSKKTTWIRTISSIILPFVIGAIYYFTMPSQSGFEPIHKALALVVFLLAILFQTSLLISIFHNSAKLPIEYYRALIDSREQQKMQPFVESYRHLREHGNSFLIVFFEFMLGFVISGFTNAENVVNSSLLPEDAIRNLFLIISFWILPACGIWFFGNKLEHSLVQNKFLN